ncbi:MAG: hypothetical protein AAF546_10665 [Verrucomicrobiota bacterium]
MDADVISNEDKSMLGCPGIEIQIVIENPREALEHDFGNLQ